jgi:hypothetical protein
LWYDDVCEVTAVNEKKDENMTEKEITEKDEDTNGCYVLLVNGKAMAVSAISKVDMEMALAIARRKSDASLNKGVFMGCAFDIMWHESFESEPFECSDVKEAFATLKDLKSAMSKQSSEPVSE